MTQQNNPRRNFLRTSAMAALVTSGLLAVRVGHAELDNIQQRGRIRIAIDPAAPPYSTKDVNLAFTGSEVDVAELLAKDLGLSLEIVPTSAANRIPYLMTDKADLVISTLSITPERAKVIDFSVPYSGIQVIVAAPHKLVLTRLDELVGKSVAVVRGSTNDAELTRAAVPGTNIVRFEDDATAITAILSGQAQAYCTAPALLAPLNARQPDLAMEPKLVVKTNLTGIGIAKNQPRLRGRLDAWVRENLRNGKLNAIYRKHHGTDLSPEVARAAAA